MILSTWCFSGSASSVRPTRRAAILEEMADAGEEGTGDEEAELIGEDFSVEILT